MYTNTVYNLHMQQRKLSGSFFKVLIHVLHHFPQNIELFMDLTKLVKHVNGEVLEVVLMPHK